MGLAEIAAAIGTGVASNLGADATRAAATTAAERAGDVDHELDVVDGPAPAPLWSPINPRMREVTALSEDQAAIVAALLRDRDTELDRILAQLRSQAFQTYVQPYWFAAGDNQLVRSFPELPGDGGWTFDGVTAWTDPAANGDANVLLASDSVLAVPMRFVAARNNPARVQVELPVPNNSSQQFRFTVTPGAGGAAGDRVAVLARFKRGG